MRRQALGAVVVPLLLVATGCGSSAAEEPFPTPVAVPSSMVTGAETTEADPGGAATDQAVQDDLSSGRARHTIRSSGVTATIDYETRKPASPWTATGEKPLRVEVKVSRPSKKVYLNRVTLRFVTNDGTGDNPGPDPIVDTSSNIVPGYLVAPPYSYVQAFAVPAVDPSTVAMTIDVKLEFVSLVDKGAKDYTKQTITDSVTTKVG